MKFIILISILTLLRPPVFAFYDDDFTEQTASIETLRLVQVLYRHGDRSQIDKYKNDIYKESDWPQGYGQLSTQGMQQEFMLGEFFRQEYIETGFLDDEYTRSEVYVRSTSFDRALMSAYCVLAALFPPVQEDRHSWNFDIAWQPVPVHTVPIDEDYLLVYNFSCPVYEEASSRSQEIESITEQTVSNFSEFYDYVSEYSGEPNTWEGIGRVLDPIFCQNASGFELPDWVTSDVLDEIVELRDIYSTVRSFPTDFAYLRGGLLVGEMLEHMINKSKNDESTPQKLFMYSAHDSTVILFLTTLGLFNYKQPPYTACVIVELHELQAGEFAVQFLYKNETDEIPYVLKLPDCDELCPLDTFAQIMKPFIPKNIKDSCGLNSTDNIQTVTEHYSSIAVIVLLCLILIMVVVFVIFCFIKRDKLVNTHDYMPVPLEMSETS